MQSLNAYLAARESEERAWEAYEERCETEGVEATDDGFEAFMESLEDRREDAEMELAEARREERDW